MRPNRIHSTVTVDSVWRFSHEAFKKICLKPTVKYSGGGIMLWAYISSHDSGELAIMNGTMNSTYQYILRAHLPSSARKLFVR